MSPSASCVRRSRATGSGSSVNSGDAHEQDPVAVGAASARRCAPTPGSARRAASSGSSSCSTQPAAHRAGADRDDDVVDRAAVRVLDRLDLVERELAEREASVGGDLPVERRAAARSAWAVAAADPSARSAPIARRGERGPRCPRPGSRRRSPARPRRSASSAAASAARAAGSAGRRAGRAPASRLRAARRRHRRGLRLAAAPPLRREVEQQPHDLGAGHAVDDRVVDLREHRDVARLQAVDQVELPQRPAAVERPRGDPRDLLGELLVVARRRQRDLADVEVAGRSRCRPPSRGSRGPAAPRPGASAAAAAGAAARRSAPGRPAQLSEPAGRRRRVEDRQARDVSGLARGLEGEELRVEARQLAHPRTVA